MALMPGDDPAKEYGYGVGVLDASSWGEYGSAVPYLSADKD
jgi:hypothetical protein